MNTQISSPPVPRSVPRLAGQKLAVAVVTGGLLLAVAIGAGVFALSTGDSSAPPVVSAPAPQVPEVNRVPSASAHVNHVYLVASQEEAALVFAGIRDANDILANSGEAPFADSVVVVTSDALAPEVLAAVEEANRIAASLGGAQSLVVDLR